MASYSRLPREEKDLAVAAADDVSASMHKERNGWPTVLLVLWLSVVLTAGGMVLSNRLGDVRHVRKPAQLRENASRQASLQGETSPPATGSSLLGPVIPFNFPDPAILYHNGVTYAFATNNRVESLPDLIHIQVATSSDNHTWSLHSTHDALPFPGPWAIHYGVWAPDVIRLEDGTFVMYYTAQHRHYPGTHCVSAAISPPGSPLGPYTPLDSPIACPAYIGGAIDPDGFFDPATGRRYITYKVDGNNIGHGGSCRNSIPPLVPTPVMIQEVSVLDGVTPIGSPTVLLDRIAEDGPLIEAPSLYRSAEGVYFLFYSSNCFTTEWYDIKYATALNITGPYERADHALLRSGDGSRDLGLVGPGGMDVLTTPLPKAERNRYADADDKDDNQPQPSFSDSTTTTRVVFHGILSESQMPDGYHPFDFTKSLTTRRKGWEVHAKRRDPMPKRPAGLIRGMYQGEIRFEGRRAWVV